MIICEFSILFLADLVEPGFLVDGHDQFTWPCKVSFCFSSGPYSNDVKYCHRIRDLNKSTYHFKNGA